MGFPILVRWHLYIVTGSCWHCDDKICFQYIYTRLALRGLTHSGLGTPYAHRFWSTFDQVMAFCQTTSGQITRTILIARFMRPTWGPSGADRTQVGPMLAPWTLQSGQCWHMIKHYKDILYEVLYEVKMASCKRMYLSMSSTKYQPFHLGFNVLKQVITQVTSSHFDAG